MYVSLSATLSPSLKIYTRVSLSLYIYYMDVGILELMLVKVGCLCIFCFLVMLD